MSATGVATPVYTILELQHRIPEGKLTDAQRERESWNRYMFPNANLHVEQRLEH